MSSHPTPLTDREPASQPPTKAQIRRWRRYLANERAEARTYRDLAERRTGEEREILLSLAEAEGRHEAHWLGLLGEHGEANAQADFGTKLMSAFTRRFGSVFTLALMQNAEARSPYADDPDATEQMAADERIHEEVVRSLAARSRSRMSGMFRAAVFGANDGLVSNLALVLGVGATGVAPQIVLATGIAGLLAGALSMGAGEYVSVTSQRELLAASTPNPEANRRIPELDVDSNELALVYRARGMSREDADARVAEVFNLLAAHPSSGAVRVAGDNDTAEAKAELEELGTPWGAAISSFLFFAGGAIIPVLPWIFGMVGVPAVIVAAVIVGLALLLTGGIVGVLSGATPWKRALRQLLIGYGAAGITYLLGWLFGASVS